MTRALKNCYFVNHGLDDLEIPVRVGFDADFADIFEVRGTAASERDAGWRPRSMDNSAVVLSYEGLDRVVRETSHSRAT